MARRVAALLLATSLTVGCSILTSLDDLGQVDGALPDASGGDVVTGIDGSQDVAVQDVSQEGAPTDSGNGNLVPNPSFDEGQGGCGPGWGNGYGMTFTRISPGRTGAYACEVCVQGTTGSYQLDLLQTIPVQAGAYYAEGWLATPDGGLPPAAGAGIQVVYDIDAGISGCSGIGSLCQGTFNPLSSAWQKSTASFSANGPGTVKVVVHAYSGTPSSCFVVDDVALYAQ